MKQTKIMLENFADMPLPGWDVLTPSYQLRHFGKNENIFTVGEWQPYVYVVRSGIVKLTYLSESGEEWIKSFISEGDFFACPNVLITGLTTDYFATAVDACDIEQVDYAAVNQLTEQYPVWQRAIRQLLAQHIVRKEQRERELLTMAPEARYQSFLKTYPTIAARIQLRDVAHYLGVTPEALSRIRKRIASD